MPVAGDSPPIPLGFNPQLYADMEAWEAAQQQIQQLYAQMKALAAGLSSTGNVMFEVMEFMNAYGNVEGAQVQAEAAVSNVDSDLRNLFSAAQGDFNTAMTDASSGTTYGNAIGPLNDLVNQVSQIQMFITYEQELPPSEQVIDPASLTNMQNALNSIQTPFGSDWGNNLNNMALDMYNWEQTGSGEGNPASIQAVQNGFQTGNQTTSGLTTTANTDLQFISQEISQFLGMEQSAIQALQQQTAQMVQNQISH